MRRFQISVVSFLAVFAMGVVIEADASAVEFLLAAMLKNGAEITASTPADMEGELELIDTKAPLVGEVAILCTQIIDIIASVDGKGSVMKILNLAGTEINGTALTAPGLVCTSTKNCGGTPEVWAEELPWEIETHLMVDPTNFFAHLIKKVKYAAECTEAGIAVQDLCEAPEVAAELTNEAAGVDVLFSDSFQELAGLKLGTCSLGGAESAIVNGLWTMLFTEGGTATISSE